MQLDAELSSLRPRPNPNGLKVRLMMDRAVLEQVFTSSSVFHSSSILVCHHPMSCAVALTKQHITVALVLSFWVCRKIRLFVVKFQATLYIFCTECPRMCAHRPNHTNPNEIFKWKCSRKFVKIMYMQYTLSIWYFLNSGIPISCSVRKILCHKLEA